MSHTKSSNPTYSKSIFRATDKPKTILTKPQSYSKAIQHWRYIADRTGIISYANLPPLWMFSGRNNIFLWLTGWSFSSFNIFHRHIARVATIQAIVHSIGWSAIEIDCKSKSLPHVLTRKCVLKATRWLFHILLEAEVLVYGRNGTYNLLLLVHSTKCSTGHDYYELASGPLLRLASHETL